MWLVLMTNVSFGQESVGELTQVSDSYMKSDAFQIGVEPSTFLSFGATSGLSLSSKNGVFVGLESAISRVNGNRLFGLSGDVLWDTGLGGVSATIGPRMGLLMVSIDGGVSLRHDFDGASEVGSQMRASCNLGFGSMYYRVGFWPETEALSTVHQLGLSLKFPQQLGYKPRTGEE